MCNRHEGPEDDDLQGIHSGWYGSFATGYTATDRRGVGNPGELVDWRSMSAYWPEGFRPQSSEMICDVVSIVEIILKILPPHHPIGGANVHQMQPHKNITVGVSRTHRGDGVFCVRKRCPSSGGGVHFHIPG